MKKLLSAIGILGIGFAWFWGDCTSALVIVSSADKYPFSYVMQQMVSGAAEVRISAILYIIVPVVVSGAGVVAGGFIDREK